MLARYLAGQAGVQALLAGTDGTDGPTAAAGAFITPDTLTRARAAGLVVAQVLEQNDSGSFFDRLGDLFVTGPTGTTVYRGDAYGPEFVGNTFTGDAGGNLVHRKILHPDGVGLIGKRPDDEQGFEFLASRDTWFRPVNFANAPDGCLYVIDMYREVIEHPWSIPESIKQHINLNSGNHRGRIYRIVHKSNPAPFKTPKLSQAATSELAALLGDGNGCTRDTAQQITHGRPVLFPERDSLRAYILPVGGHRYPHSKCAR